MTKMVINDELLTPTVGSTHIFVPGVFDMAATAADQKSHFFAVNLCSHIFPPSISRGRFPAGAFP